MHFLKAWVIGFAFSLIVVASEAAGPHTPFNFLIFFDLPLFLFPEVVLGRARNEDYATYAVMLFFGSLIYGLVSYLILVFIGRVRKSKAGLNP